MIVLMIIISWWGGYGEHAAMTSQIVAERDCLAIEKHLEKEVSHGPRYQVRCVKLNHTKY